MQCRGHIGQSRRQLSSGRTGDVVVAEDGQPAFWLPRTEGPRVDHSHLCRGVDGPGEFRNSAGLRHGNVVAGRQQSAGRRGRFVADLDDVGANRTIKRDRNHVGITSESCGDSVDLHRRNSRFRAEPYREVIAPWRAEVSEMLVAGRSRMKTRCQLQTDRTNLRSRGWYLRVGCRRRWLHAVDRWRLDTNRATVGEFKNCMVWWLETTGQRNV